MTEKRIERRLAAILAADVVGFSRLTGADEDRTLARLRALRSDLIDPTIAVHNGRVVKRTGDGAIVEFRSVVEAVRCAIEIQNAMIERNAGVPVDRRIEFRIGIHLGDIVEEIDGDLMGDGVNIAARLEGVAAPGTICLSDDAYRQVKSRLDLAVSDLGETRLKNIVDPMRVYSLQVGVSPEVKSSSRMETASSPTNSTLVDKPSIAVLPFTNMSSDVDQQYFSDGITEDIITELSRFRSLLVIARNSSFQFRGASVDHVEVRNKLGIRYIVTGSIRRLADNIRITVELIDARSGSQLWAERYDRNWQDIFSIQDELVRRIVGTVEGRVISSGAAEAQRKQACNRTAYELMMQARDFWYRYDAKSAEEPLRAALALDPNYSDAHAWLALSLFLRWASEQLDEALIQESLTHGKRAVVLDTDSSLSHWALAHVLIFLRRHHEAALHYDRALELNPNDGMGRTSYAYLLLLTGRATDAIEQLNIVRERDPYPPLWFWEVCGHANYQLQKFDDAIAAYHKMGEFQFWSHYYLAASYAMSDRLQDARRHIDAGRVVAPTETLRDWERTEPFQYRPGLELLLQGLRKAGMPD